MSSLRIALAGLLALASGSCGESRGPDASESLSDAIIQPVQSGDRGPMLCVDSVAVHIHDEPWQKSLRVWSTTDHERIVELVHAVRMPSFHERDESQDDFVTLRDDVRIFFVCRSQNIFASVRVVLPRDGTMRWEIQDGTAGSVWQNQGALKEVMRRLGISRAAGIE